MKIPLSKIAKAIGEYQAVNKRIGEYPNESETGLLKIIKDQEEALHNKNAEIFTLRHRIKDLEENLTITNELREEAEIKLNHEGGF